MSFMDTLKDKLGMSKGKAGDLAQQHGDQVNQGIDRAGQTLDDRTGGKYSDRIDTGTDKAKDAMGNRKDEGRNGSM
jgi:hypothetical protein